MRQSSLTPESSGVSCKSLFQYICKESFVSWKLIPVNITHGTNKNYLQFLQNYNIM